MKKLYALILLLSFVVGTLQPILPMIQYQLFEGNISELVTHAKQGHDNVKLNKTVAVITVHHESTQHKDDGKSLLNDNYYPLGIDTSMAPPVYIFSFIDRWYPSVAVRIESPSFIPNPPPPRVA